MLNHDPMPVAQRYQAQSFFNHNHMPGACQTFQLCLSHKRNSLTLIDDNVCSYQLDISLFTEKIQQTSTYKPAKPTTPPESKHSRGGQQRSL